MLPRRLRGPVRIRSARPDPPRPFAAAPRRRLARQRLPPRRGPARFGRGRTGADLARRTGVALRPLRGNGRRERRQLGDAAGRERRRSGLAVDLAPVGRAAPAGGPRAAGALAPSVALAGLRRRCSGGPLRGPGVARSGDDAPRRRHREHVDGRRGRGQRHLGTRGREAAAPGSAAPFPFGLPAAGGRCWPISASLGGSTTRAH